MELNLHRVTECTVKRDYHAGGDEIIPGLPSPAFHVTYLAIVYDDGRTAKVRLFGQQRLIITEGDDDGSTASMDA